MATNEMSPGGEALCQYGGARWWVTTPEQGSGETFSAVFGKVTEKLENLDFQPCT